MKLRVLFSLAMVFFFLQGCSSSSSPTDAGTDAGTQDGDGSTTGDDGSAAGDDGSTVGDDDDAGIDDGDAGVDGGDAGIDDGDAGVEDGDAGADSDTDPTAEFTYEPEDLVLEEFTIKVSVSSTIGRVGEEFELEAILNKGEPVGQLVYAWDFGDGQRSIVNPADGAIQAVVFNTPGNYLVSVEASDDDGHVTEAGAYFVVLEADQVFTLGDVDDNGVVELADADLVRDHMAQEVALGLVEAARADIDLDSILSEKDVRLIELAAVNGLAPRYLSAAEGSFGKLLWMTHPELLEPSAQVTIQFDGAEAQVPVRTRPGYATFVVPLELTTPGAITLKLLVGGVEQDSFDFTILAPPVASNPPGDKIVDLMGRIDTAIEVLPDLLTTYLDEIQASDDEKAAVLGMLLVADNSFSAHRESFVEAFLMMEDEGKELFEQIALANDLDEVLDQLTALEIELSELPPPAPPEPGLQDVFSEATVEAICLAHKIVDIAEKVAYINDIAAAVVNLIDFFPLNRLPIVRQVIGFLKGITQSIGAITDVILGVKDYLPKLGEVGIETERDRLIEGQSTLLSPYVQILFDEKLCNKDAAGEIDTLITKLKASLTRRLALMIPTVGAAYRAAGYNIDEMNVVHSLIVQAVGYLAGRIIDALGVDEYLKSLALKICAFISEWHLPLAAESLESTLGEIVDKQWACAAATEGASVITATVDLCGTETQNRTPLTLTCRMCPKGELAVTEDYLYISTADDLSQLEGYTSIAANGYVWIESESIENLHGLECLQFLKPNEYYSSAMMIYRNPLLRSLEGLDNLQEAFYFYGMENPSLEKIDSLRSLREVQIIQFRDNPKLTSFDGLESLETVREEFISSHNSPEKFSLAALTSLQKVGNPEFEGYFFVEEPALENLTGIENLDLTNTNFGLSCDGSEKLTDISAISDVAWGNLFSLYLIGCPGIDFSTMGDLNSVTLIEIEDMAISDCTAFRQLGALRRIDLKGNQHLVSLNGLENIDVSYLHLAGNPVLSDISALSSLGSVSNTFILTDLPALPDFSGLESLASAGNIYVNSFQEMTVFSGMDALVSVNEIFFSMNPELTTISIPALMSGEVTVQLCPKIQRIELAPGSGVGITVCDVALPIAQLCDLYTAGQLTFCRETGSCL
jgi:PKD domain-containing protein